MERQLDTFDDIVVKDITHRHQYQSTSTGDILKHVYSHVQGNNTNVSVAEIVSADNSNQGQWDLLLHSPRHKLVANAITAANAASLTANSIISVRADTTTIRSANVNVQGTLHVSQEFNANTARFNTCFLNGPVSGPGVTSLVKKGSNALVTSGGVYTAIQNGGGTIGVDPIQPTIRTVGTLTSLNVAGNLDVGEGTLRVENNAVRIGQTFNGQWVTATGAHDKTWSSVAFGNGAFVAVGSGGQGNRAMRSLDGKTWTSGQSASDNPWSAIAYGNGVFVAVASSGSNRCMTSVNNGLTWTGRSAFPNTWSGIAFGGLAFVAVSKVASGVGNFRVMRTTDNASNWTFIQTPQDNDWTSITYAKNTFVAVASSGNGNRVMTSPTGETWTVRTTPANNSWTSVTYGNGLFVAVSSDGGSQRVMTSPTGQTWTLRTTPTSPWTSVAYGKGLFMATASSGAVMSSHDGITWTLGQSASNNSWTGIAYGNTVFVAVALTGSGDRAMYVTAPISANLDVRTVTITGNVEVGDSLRVEENLAVGQVTGPRIDLSKNAVLFSSNGVVDSSLTTTGAIANAGNGTAELRLNASDFTYVGTTFNDGTKSSTGVVNIQAYPRYPVITDSAQSTRQYALGERFWSGKVPRNSATPQKLQLWGNENFPLYGTYTVQLMTKSGTFHNAVAMCMRGSVASPGNTNAITWATLSSSTSSTSGLSIAFGVVNNWVPQISLQNNTGVHAWFHISAVVFDEAAIHQEATS